MSMLNTSSACAASSRVTWSRIRRSGSIVVSHSSLAFISPRPLKRWMKPSLGALLPGLQPGLHQRIPFAVAVGVLVGLLPPHLSRNSGGCAKYTWPSMISGRINRNNNVSSSVRMCWPSTSASAIKHEFVVPELVQVEFFLNTGAQCRDHRLHLVVGQDPVQPGFSTFRILPRMGRIAWVAGSRPLRAEPPAESPSTMNSSHSSGLVEEQSMSFPGSPAAEQAFAVAGQVACLASGHPRHGRRHRLAGDFLCLRPGSSRTTPPTGRSPASVRTSWPRCCPVWSWSDLELRLAQFHTDDGSQSSRMSSPVRLVSLS